MPIVHIEQLSGDDAGHWIAYAKSELRRWSEFNEQNATWSRTLTPTEGVTIRLRQCGQFQYIAINATGATYAEFETSGLPVVNETIPGAAFVITSAYKPAVVSFAFDGTKVKSRIRRGTRSFSAGEVSRIKRPNQVNLANEPAQPVTPKDLKTGDPKIKHYARVLYESAAPFNPYTGVYQRAINFVAPNHPGDVAGCFMSNHARDIGYDIPWMDGSGVATVRLAALNNNTVDWPRASGLVTVTDPIFGKREFAIYIDANDQFFVFPTSQIDKITIGGDGNPIQNVASKYVKQAAVVWPAGLWRKSERYRDFIESPPAGAPGADGLSSTQGTFGAYTGTLGDFPEYDWRVHPDGTKACAVMFYREPAIYDVAYTSTSTSTETDFNENLRDQTTGIYGLNGFGSTVFPAYLPQRYSFGNALIEVALNLALTGTDPEDFTFSATANVVRDPNTSDYWTFLTGYSWYDIAVDDSVPFAERAYQVNRGDLLSLDIERYYQPTTGTIGDGEGPYLTLLRLRNLTKDTVLNTFGGDSTDVTQLLAYDMASASFAFQAHTRTMDTRGAIDYYTSHPAAVIVTFNKQRTIIYPDTMPSAQRDTIAASMATPPDTAGWTYIAPNDARDWTDTTLSTLRDWWSNLHMGRASGAAAPSSDTWGWFCGGLTRLSELGPATLPFITAPKFGWYAYNEEIMLRNAVSPFTTFFVHPSGSWSFFCQNRIYNGHGMPIATFADTLTDVLANADKFEHVIYDAVHLQNSKGSLDTTFIDMYNAAVQDGIYNNSLTDTFSKITKAQAKAVIMLDRYSVTTPLAQDVLRLNLNFGGQNWYYFDARFASIDASGDGLGAYDRGGGTYAMTLGDILWNVDQFNVLNPNNGSLAIGIPAVGSTPFTVSSMLEIT